MTLARFTSRVLVHGDPFEEAARAAGTELHVVKVWTEAPVGWSFSEHEATRQLVVDVWAESPARAQAAIMSALGIDPDDFVVAPTFSGMVQPPTSAGR